MAATPLTVTQVNRTGVAPASYATSDNTNGNTIPNDGRTWLELSNTGGSTATLSIQPAREVDGQPAAAETHAIAAAAFLKVGPFPPRDFGSQISVTSTASTLKIAAYSLSSD